MRDEAAGLLELRGAKALYFTPSLLFFSFSLPERGACAGERHEAPHSRFWRTHDYSTCHPLGSAFRGCEGATGAGAAVAATRGVPCNACRLPWPVRAPPRDGDFPKRLFPGGTMD